MRILEFGLQAAIRRQRNLLKQELQMHKENEIYKEIHSVCFRGRLDVELFRLGSDKSGSRKRYVLEFAPKSMRQGFRGHRRRRTGR